MALSSRGSTAFTEARVPTTMNAGVSSEPCLTSRRPVRASEPGSLAVTVNFRMPISIRGGDGAMMRYGEASRKDAFVPEQPVYFARRERPPPFGQHGLETLDRVNGAGADLDLFLRALRQLLEAADRGVERGRIDEDSVGMEQLRQFVIREAGQFAGA